MIRILDDGLKIGIFKACADASLFNIWKRDLKFKWKQSTLLGELKKEISVHNSASIYKSQICIPQEEVPWKVAAKE